MKIIGLMLTWNNLEFFKCALQQALYFCDEVIIAEGCHSKSYPKHSTDGTYEYIKSLKNPKLKILDLGKRLDRYDKTQKLLREKLPQKSQYWKPGNWLFFLDDDIFFSKQDLSKLKTAMQTSKLPALAFKVRYFIYNFRFNFLQNGGPLCYKILDNFEFRGIGYPCYKRGGRFAVNTLNDVTCFHYAYVKKSDRMKARWVMSMEKGTRASLGRFDKWMNIEWTKEEDIYEQDKDFAKIRPGKGLNVYEGMHPFVLNKHPWHYIDDVRKIK